MKSRLQKEGRRPGPTEHFGEQDPVGGELFTANG